MGGSGSSADADTDADAGAPADRLAELTHALERVARRLRTDDLEPEHAARLVEDCARLAGELAAELERAARGPATGPASAPES